MPAYIMVNCRVIDAEQYEEYKRLAQAAVAQYGGRYLVRGGESVILEGTWRLNRIVVLEFPSLQQAKIFYESPEYREARAARAGAAEMDMIAVAGV